MNKSNINVIEYNVFTNDELDEMTKTSFWTGFLVGVSTTLITLTSIVLFETIKLLM